MDTACSASMFALNQALASIRKGDCDAAIVGGANICLQPITSLHFMKLGMLNDAGMCRSFDEKGNLQRYATEIERERERERERTQHSRGAEVERFFCVCFFCARKNSNKFYFKNTVHIKQ